jgi:pyruvate, water dikinase
MSKLVNNILEGFKIMFSRRKQGKITFQKKFYHFQELLRANDLVHKYMSDFGEMIVNGDLFSKGYATRLYKGLYDNALRIVKNLIIMSHGKHQELLDKLIEIADSCNQVLQPRVFCPEGLDCQDANCPECSKYENNPDSIPYYYNLFDLTSEHDFETGAKMSRLGEISSKLGLPVPDGFSLTIRLFEDLMTNENLREKKNEIFYNVDFEDISHVMRASRDAQALFISIPIPQKVEDIIIEAYDKYFGKDSGVKLAVRSSARGEDSTVHSFAGLHYSALNVSRENLVDACLEVLISKYSPQSVVYRYINGLRDEDMPMSVGCIRMIDAIAGGVLFTRQAGKNGNNVIINAVYGLGSLVVEGRVTPQQFIVSRNEPHKVVSFSSGNQKYKNIVKLSDGLEKAEVTPEFYSKPCLNPEQLAQLCNYALKIEKHFGTEQDIEWAVDKNDKIFILQARPLKLQQRIITKEESIELSELDRKYNVLIDYGDCASRGIATGKAFILQKDSDIKKVPHGSILVARKNIPEFASILHKLAGVITNTGSTTGHLSIIAKEQGIPVLTNTENATEKLSQEQIITLYSDELTVYEGKVEELFKMKNLEKENPFLSSPLYRIWHRISKYIFKLNLTKPNSHNFHPYYCQTFHDIIRFAHETSMKEMFSIYENTREYHVKTFKLKFEIPLDVYVIDLGNGVEESIEGNAISYSNIRSVPFKFLIDGMQTSGIQWGGPLGVDVRGFMNIIKTNINDTNRGDRGLGSRSYALISEDYVNFFSRLGYHFSRLDSLASEEINSNYINFHFRGGAADPIRRSRRATAIKRILEHYHFSTSLIDDNVIGTIRKVSKENIYTLLVELGRLMGAVRNTDVTMVKDSHIDFFVKAFLDGDPAPASRFLDIG